MRSLSSLKSKPLTQFSMNRIDDSSYQDRADNRFNHQFLNQKREVQRAPSVLVSSSNARSISPSIRALLEPNFQFNLPHLNIQRNPSIRISPYEINENPFSEIDINLNPKQLIKLSKTACISPRNENQMSQSRLSTRETSRQNLQAIETQRYQSQSKNLPIVSIENFDPKIFQPFTEPYTVKAIKMLGIQQSDLYYPTKEELDKIGGDRVYFREILTERANKYAELVKKERKQLIMNDLSLDKMADQEKNSDDFQGNPTYLSDAHYGYMNRSDQLLTNNRNDLYSRSNLTTAQKRSRSENGQLLSTLPIKTAEMNRRINNQATLSQLPTQRMNGFATQSGTSQGRRQLAVERATRINELQIEEKRRLVDQIEKRHEKILREQEIEKIKNLQKQQEKNERQKLRSQLFNQRQREEQVQKIEAYVKKSNPNIVLNSNSATSIISEINQNRSSGFVSMPPLSLNQSSEDQKQLGLAGQSLLSSTLLMPNKF